MKRERDEDIAYDELVQRQVDDKWEARLREMGVPVLDDRFWSKVQRSDDSQCWPWLGAKNPQGYGTYRLNGFMQRAARVVTAAPAGTVVRHKCDNPSCVNPSHLVIGTQKQNVRDCSARGRRADAVGESNNFSKLTEEQVKSIREQFAAIATYPSGRKEYGQVQKLADKYGITDVTVYHIVNRKTWSHI